MTSRDQANSRSRRPKWSFWRRYAGSMADTVDVERGSPLQGVELTREQKLQLYRDGFIVLSA